MRNGQKPDNPWDVSFVEGPVNLEPLIVSIVERLDAGIELYEEPNVELKNQWPEGSEKEQIWEIADLVAALANDAHLPGVRGIVCGPATEIDRPAWLTDEAVLRPKLLRYFEGGVVPRVELIRRDLQDGQQVDFLMIVDRSESPYVTRFPVGGEWAVREELARHDGPQLVQSFSLWLKREDSRQHPFESWT